MQLLKILILIFSLNLFSQEEEIVFFSKENSKAIFDEEKNFEAHLNFKIISGWHINANKIKDEFLIPTEIKIENKDLKIKEIIYPEGKKISLGFSKAPLLVYNDTFEIKISGKFLNEIKDFKGKIIYQACNDEMCIPPQELPFSIEFEKGSVALSNPIERWISKGGFILALIFLFIGGLALNLTPCVYPMIPITIGFFSKQKKSFIFSLSYFMGIVITYSLLGTFSALGGSIFGSALQKPFVLIFVSIIIFLFALSLFGLYTIKLPSGFSDKISSKIGILSVFLMGSMVGLIAAPCLGPIIFSLITFVASKGDPLVGFLFFFSLSMGLGFPYLILSFFSSSIKSLPKSGEWMVSLERFFGFALTGVSIFILSPLLPSKFSYFLYSTLGTVSAIYFFKLFLKRNKILNFSLMALSLIFTIISLNSLILREEKIKLFNPYSKNEFLKALETGKPVIIDFYAKWCIPCREMDHKTFSKKEIQEILKNFVLFKVDLTKEPEGEIKELVENINIEGMPTIVFFKNGKEVKDLRLIGFEGPEKFKARLKKALE